MNRRALHFWFATLVVMSIPARADLTSTDSAPFDINTALTTTVPSFSDSAAFNLNTSLTFTTPAYSDSPSTSFDTRNINRAWGDSEPFSMNVPHAAPTLNSAVPQCDGITPGIRLTWTAAPGATNYDIFRNNALIFTTQTNGTTFWNVTNLSAGATYTYKIRARFGAITSPHSNPVSAVAPTCQAPPPANNPPPGNPGPTPVVTIDRLWAWNAGEGRFKAGPITVNQALPTYVIAHGWDGALNGVGVSNPSCQSTAFAMSSIACAIRQKMEANIYAWDWAEAANPNRKCDADILGSSGLDLLTDLLSNYIHAPASAFQFAIAAIRAAAGGFHLGVAIGEAYADAKASAEGTQGEGAALATALRQLVQANNGTIGTQLHFIGHSHGGGLVGEAARRLGSTYLVNSLTALDTPHFFSVDTQKLIDPSAQLGTVFFYYPITGLGFGRAPLPYGGTSVQLSPTHLLGGCSVVGHTWIHGCDPTCTPSTPDGWFPGAILTDPTFDGVPRSVLDGASLPSGYFGESLANLYEFSPLAMGACCFQSWCEITSLSNCSALGGQFMNVNSTCLSCPTAQTRTDLPGDSNLAGMSLLLYDPLDDASSWQGTTAQLVIGADPDDPNNRAVVLTEQGEASLFKDIVWPVKAVYLTFDYMFREIGAEESLTVYLNDQVVHYDNAQTSSALEHLTSTRAIYVGQAAGTTVRLTFVLRAGETSGGSSILDNIRVWGFIPGDMTGDGKLDALDIAPFITAVLAASTDPGDLYIADFDISGTVDFSDMQPFVTALLGS